ncbi:MAG: stage II sporulation protein R [Clostridia bacterium]|nr:stage II sporulation protein R [Clostridia bacterium]
MKKKFFIIVIMLLLFVLSPLAACTNNRSKYVRIHIRANSDSEYDQQVKLEVRDSVIACLAPLLEDCKDATDAKTIIAAHLEIIESTADTVLLDTAYTCKASLRRECFPQKSYGELTLKAGYYDALVLELGSGEGANWWCVAYPPLCFTASEETTVYKSKIMEIIQKNKEKD